MAKLTLTDIANISGNPTSAEANINANSAAIEAALENTLSRDGSTPNTMNASLDMNSNRLINLAAPASNTDAARWVDVTAGTSVTTAPSPVGQTDKVIYSTGTVAAWKAPGEIIFARTAAEISASVTPTNYNYDPGDVRRYGAALDGTTDDSTALTRAFQQCAQASGAAVFVPPNVTMLCAAWTTFDSTGAVVINATGAVIKGPVAGTSKLLSLGGNLILNGGRYERWGVVQERLLAQTGSITELRAVGCEFRTFTGIVINVERPIKYYWIVENIFASVANYAIKIGENTYANQDLYEKGTIADNKFLTITASGSTSCAAMLVYGREVDIDGNYISGVSGATGEGWGIYTKVRYGKITRNTVRNIKSASHPDVIGINVKGTTRLVTSSPQGYSVICSGNSIQDVGVNASVGYGIRIQTDDVNCYGNLIEDTGLGGIGVDESSAYFNINVSANDIRFITLNASTSGVRVEGGGTGVRVSDNVVANVGIGVRVQANQSAVALVDVAVLNNVMRSCTYPVMFDAQTSCTLTRPRIAGNIADGGTAGVLNNGSAGTVTGVSIIDNDFERCTTFLSGTLPNGSRVRTTVAVTTTDATLTTLFVAALADESAYATNVRCVGRKSDTTDRALYHQEALHYRDGGTATLQGTATALAAIESNAAWDAAFSVSSNSVLFRVTGVAATTINWKAHIDMIGA